MAEEVPSLFGEQQGELPLCPKGGVSLGGWVPNFDR